MLPLLLGPEFSYSQATVVVEQHAALAADFDSAPTISTMHGRKQVNVPRCSRRRCRGSRVRKCTVCFCIMPSFASARTDRVKMQGPTAAPEFQGTRKRHNMDKAHHPFSTSHLYRSLRTSGTLIIRPRGGKSFGEAFWIAEKGLQGSLCEALIPKMGP